MTNVATSDKISPQFLGQARLFRERVAPDPAVGLAMRRIGQDAIATLERRQSRGYRPETLIGYERDWRKMPANGLISLNVERTSKTLRIKDTRVNIAIVTSEQWRDHGREHALLIIESAMDLSPTYAETTSTVTATFSLFALGRFYQRADRATDEALLADLAIVAKAAPGLLMSPPGHKIQIPTSNGQWLGFVSSFGDIGSAKAPTAALRTFV